MPFYIITKAHWNADHCHVVGLYNDIKIAKKVYNEYFDKLKEHNKKTGDIDEHLFELHTISEDKINTQLYDLKCDLDIDEDDEEDLDEVIDEVFHNKN